MFRTVPQRATPPGADAPVTLSPRPGRAIPVRARTGRARPGRAGAGKVGQAEALFDAQWQYMAPAMLIAMVLPAVATASMPDPASSVAGALAFILTAAAPIFARFEKNLPLIGWQRLLVMTLAVALPMALIGFAVTNFTVNLSKEQWAVPLGEQVILSVIALTLLHGRLASLVSANVSLWIGVALVIGSMASFVVLSIGAALGIALTIRQNRIAQQAAERQREIERAQLRAEEILADFEQTGQGWFWETDRRGLLTYVSPTVSRQLGRGENDLTGRPITELFVSDKGNETSERTLNFHLSARSSFQDLDVQPATIEEEPRCWSISGRPIHDEFNNFLGFRGFGADLTEKRRSQDRVTRLARYDSLTGLANRFQMSEALEKILAARREDQRVCTVFLLDLDRFKQVNDTMGHPAGDALLKQVSQRLSRTVDKAGVVGRLGGDEFQVILSGRNSRDQLAELARRIIENLSQPYSIDGHRVVIGASLGIAQAPEDGVTSEAIIRNADLALYAAKDGGRGRYHFYDPDLHSDAEERRRLEQDLRDAIVQGGLELFYQPVVQTTTEKITGFEALLRWNHPSLGMLSPAKFVPIAEDAGLIAQIGEWALRTACHDLARWPESVRVAVNVSPLQFANPALPSIVTNALAAAQVHPSRLELEITESVFLNDDSSTEAMFAALKGVGVRLALDDFGTGYSSLGYLKKAPFDKIKIDQSFVRGATVKGSRNGAIISSIVSLAEALGMETTAEGVETLDELDLVRLLGCSHIQGYIYEKPLNARAADARLQAGMTAIAVGPRAARSQRHTMLRKVMLDHGGETYKGTIRNMSTTGAMIEGLWNVPPGTIFAVHLGEGQVVTATARWCREDRMGVEFASPLYMAENGTFAVEPPRARRAQPVVEAARLAG